MKRRSFLKLMGVACVAPVSTLSDVLPKIALLDAKSKNQYASFGEFLCEVISKPSKADFPVSVAMPAQFANKIRHMAKEAGILGRMKRERFYCSTYASEALVEDETALGYFIMQDIRYMISSHRESRSIIEKSTEKGKFVIRVSYDWPESALRFVMRNG